MSVADFRVKIIFVLDKTLYFTVTNQISKPIQIKLYR